MMQDAETVAQGLSDITNGQIRTGVYHSDVKDGAKEDLHRRWRKGHVKVVCATIGGVNRLSFNSGVVEHYYLVAFGLGIDKGDVRFVVHHSVCFSSIDKAISN